MTDHHTSAQGPTASIADKLIRNTVFNSAGRVWTMAISFLLTPFIVSRLGVEQYGIWSLVFVIVGYLGIFDFGIGVAFVKYAAQYDTERDYSALNSLSSSGISFYLVLSLMLLLGTAVSGHHILRFFQVPEAVHDEAFFLLFAAVLSLCLSNVAGLFEAIINGLQRMEITNLISMTVSVPQVLGTVLVLSLGYGLRGLVVVRALVVGMSLVLFAAWAYRLLPDLQLRPRIFRFERLRQLLRYGAPIQITALGALVNLQINKAFLGYYLGLSSITFYELGFKIVYVFITLPLLLVSAIMPAASELDARRDQQLLNQLYTRGSKYLVLAAAPLATFFILYAPLLISTWMGTQYPESVQVIRLLTGSFFINLLTAPGTSIARGIGRPGYEARYAVVTAGVHIALAVILIPALGLLGALITAFLATSVGSAYFLYLFHRHLEKPFIPFAVRVYFTPILASTVAGLIVYLMNLALGWSAPLPGRWGGLLHLSGSGLAFTALYLTGIWLLGYLDPSDRALLARRNPVAVFFRNPQ